MTTTEELILNQTGQFIDSIDGVHDVIFNRVGNWHENNGRKLFYDPDAFREATAEFNVSPFVFANKHPTNIGQMPLEDALKEVDGRIVGTPQDVFVNSLGAVLGGKIRVTDSYVEQLIKENKVELSTSFRVSVDNQGKIIKVVPNHILIYPTSTGIPPGDGAALILNQATEKGDIHMTEKTETTGLDLARDLVDSQKELIKNQADKEIGELKAIIKDRDTSLKTFEELVTNQNTEMANKDELITNQKAEISAKDKIIAEKDELITNQKAELEIAQNELKAFKVAEMKKKKDLIFIQYTPGTQKAFESRKEEIYDPEKFDDLILAMNQADRGLPFVPTTPAGSEHVVNNQGEDTEFHGGVIFEYKDGKPVARGA